MLADESARNALPRSSNGRILRRSDIGLVDLSEFDD